MKSKSSWIECYGYLFIYLESIRPNQCFSFSKHFLSFSMLLSLNSFNLHSQYKCISPSHFDPSLSNPFWLSFKEVILGITFPNSKSILVGNKYYRAFIKPIHTTSDTLLIPMSSQCHPNVIGNRLIYNLLNNNIQHIKHFINGYSVGTNFHQPFNNYTIGSASMVLMKAYYLYSLGSLIVLQTC